MAVTRSTLALTRRLRADIGTEVDGADRHLTGLWVDAWDRLAPAWWAACTELAALAVTTGRWPTRHQIARSSAMPALWASEVELGKLAEATAATASAGAERVVHIDAELEARIIASQAPATETEALTGHVRGRLTEAVDDDEPIDLTDGGMVPPITAANLIGAASIAGLVAGRFEPSALAAIIARASGQIHADTWPLTPAAIEAMRHSLIEGIIGGDNPLDVARDIFGRVEGDFNGGLTRAQTIARTEMLDAYRAASAYTHQANADVVPAWTWYARLDRLTCVACFSRHGRVYPVSEPGPDDHPRGRCTRLPKLASWKELGITAPEPPSLLPNGEQSFNRLSRADQLNVMGPGRLELYRSGAVTWDDLATWRDTPTWRRSNQPTSVRDLRVLAERNRSQEVTRVA